MKKTVIGAGLWSLLALFVVLFAVGWFLARELYVSGKLEDCLMSGRTNCAPINTH